MSVKFYLQIPCDNKRWGNKIAINMFANEIIKHLGFTEIFGASISELNIKNKPYVSTNLIRDIDLHVRAHNLSPKFIADYIIENDYRIIVIETNGLWYPTLKEGLSSFKGTIKNQLENHNSIVCENELLINIRTAEVRFKSINHPDYGLLPVDYYKKIANSTGLNPKFVGQIRSCRYLEDLQKSFPTSEFIDPGVAAAFASVYHASDKVLCLSTFSWFAAWLGNPSSTVHLPVTGFYNPLTRPDINLIPDDDFRYKFQYFDEKPKIRRHSILKRFKTRIKNKFLM